MNNDDVLPANPQARAILVALDALRMAGINASLDVTPDAEHVFSITLKYTTPEVREHLRQSIHAALEYQWQAAAADCAVIQAKLCKPV